MQNHFHTDFVSLAITTVGVVVLINLWRLGAAKLTEIPATAEAGKVLGSLVHFGS